MLHAGGLPEMIAAFGDSGQRRMVSMAPWWSFVGPSVGIRRTPWNRRPELASDLRRRRLAGDFFRFSEIGRGSRRHHYGQWRYFGVRRTRPAANGTTHVGEADRQVGGSGEILCARGRGSGPGDRLLCGVHLGGLYGEPEISSHVPGTMGRPEGAVVIV